MKRIVLGYSGGLATTVAIPWLAETHRAQVVAVTIDLGQGGELEAIRDRALAAGAVRAHVLDVRDGFGRDYITPALLAGALGRASTIAALQTPMIAKTLVEIVAIEQASAVAHCADASGSRALATALTALNPATAIVTPLMDWTMTADEQMEYARRHNVVGVNTVAETERSPVKAAEHCPDEPASVDIRIERGVPVAINSIEMPLVDLMATLGTIANAHGVADPLVTLQAAHDDLQRLTADADVDRVAGMVAREYADLIQSGRWFSPLRHALDQFVASLQQRVTGVVSLKLWKGTVETVSRQEGGPKHLPLLAVR
ncbi:MAG TPA: argininosuccinate synthase domain-containing protein [Vicinamibacterales bacterium]